MCYPRPASRSSCVNYTQQMWMHSSMAAYIKDKLHLHILMCECFTPAACIKIRLRKLYTTDVDALLPGGLYQREDTSYSCRLASNSSCILTYAKENWNCQNKSFAPKIWGVKGYCGATDMNPVYHSAEDYFYKVCGKNNTQQKYHSGLKGP